MTETGLYFGQTIPGGGEVTAEHGKSTATHHWQNLYPAFRGKLAKHGNPGSLFIPHEITERIHYVNQLK